MQAGRAPILGTGLVLSILATGACREEEGYTPPPVGEPSGGAIINGEPCGRDGEPTAVALIVDAELEVPAFGVFPIRTAACTGTVIAPDVVMAAAHCVDPTVLGQGFATARNVRFYVTREPDLVPLMAMRTTELPGDAVEASSWVAHPGFDIQAWNAVNGPGRYDDIALLFLSEPLRGVEPERVITAGERDRIQTGASVTIAGWGAQTEDVGNLLMPPPEGTVGRKMCGDAFLGEVGPFEFQVGTDRASTRKCRGDSGGPTYLVVAPGTAFPRRVVGVTSHAYDTSLCDEGGIDTRVDAYLDWLEAELTGACRRGARAWCAIPGLIPPDAGPVAIPVDSPAPDAGLPDLGAPDLGGRDAGAPDLGGRDAGATDLGRPGADVGVAGPDAGEDPAVGPLGLDAADGGCRCAGAAGRAGRLGPIAGGLAGLMALLRRRRRR